MRSHRWQPTRLPGPWDSPGKNTGVGCHFLLQCMKVKSESEVAQSCPTLSDPMNCSPPGSSVHGIFQARVLEWGAIAHHNSKVSILWHSAFFMVQLSHLYMTTGKTIALTICIFVGVVMSLLFNMLSRLIIREGNGNPLQYSCLENTMDGGAWWTAVHGFAKSRTRLSDFTFTFMH